MPFEKRPRVLIMGACRGAGRACAKTFAKRGADTILADNDGPALRALSHELGAVGQFCDILSESSVRIFADHILRQIGPIDMLVNAAGSGFERTWGMHRVSRALMPALKSNPGGATIVNIPPPAHKRGATIFSYASSWRAYDRLCNALQEETRGSRVAVRTAGSPTPVTFDPGNCLSCGSGFEPLARLIESWLFDGRATDDATEVPSIQINRSRRM